MKIIHVPHPLLRQVAQPITTVDKKLQELIKDLETTLQETTNPQGVGLAAPQINTSRRLFATYLPVDPSDENAPSVMRVFINPEIIEDSGDNTFGPDEDNPFLEGCLSIPRLYGPVPRLSSLRLRFDVVQGSELVSMTESFADFAARVVQHELDHLEGILFTDYSFKYDLPVFEGNSRNDKLVEIDKNLITAF